MKPHESCFYCDGPISKDILEMDHFPIPKRHGGKLTVPVCLSCHDAKDRFKIESWNTTWATKVIADFPNLSRETRIFLAKAIFIVLDAKESNERRNREAPSA